MMEWNYAHDADITIGEVHLSNTAKIILILLIIFLLAGGGLAIYFRSYIYDYIADPEIILIDDTVELEVHSSFDEKKYINNLEFYEEASTTDASGRYSYVVEGLDKVNTDKLGEYTITYKSKNSVKSKEVTLKVKVVDTTAPKITLKKDVVLLTRGKDTDKFNPRDYLDSVSDNYTKTENIKIDFTKNINFDADEFEVIYTATDESENMATAKLSLVIFDSEEEKQEEEKKQNEDGEDEGDSTDKPTEKPTDKPTETQTQTPTTQSQTQAPTTQATTQATTEATTQAAPDPYISGVHDISVPVGTDYGTMVASLISGVTGSGYVSCDYSSVNLTVAGTYPVYWSSDDGASATSYVTVTE